MRLIRKTPYLVLMSSRKPLRAQETRVWLVQLQSRSPRVILRRPTSIRETLHEVDDVEVVERPEESNPSERLESLLPR